MKSVLPFARKTAFAPATVANVACGFDVLGLALEAPGDTVTAELADEPGVQISRITGDGGRLSLDPARNTASVAARKALELAGPTAAPGIRLQIQKGLPLSSGMGSSAASAVASVLAVSSLLGLRLGYAELLAASLEAERVVAGAGHPDNAAACLSGGFVLVRSTSPLDVVRLPIPPGLSVAILRPHIEVSTRAARNLLPDRVALADAVQQWANVGALVSGLHSGDLDLVSRALVDFVAEPVRSSSVPGFLRVKGAAIGAGALGSSLSGSGPSIFALCRDLESAQVVARKMADAFAEATSLPSDLHVSKVSAAGARLVDERTSACDT